MNIVRLLAGALLLPTMTGFVTNPRGSRWDGGPAQTPNPGQAGPHGRLPRSLRFRFSRGPDETEELRTVFHPVTFSPHHPYTLVFHGTSDFQGNERWLVEHIPADVRTGATAYDGIASKSDPFVPALLCQVFGAGLKARVEAGLEDIASLTASGSAPRTVNAVGWSRGAVTLIHLANSVARDRTLRRRVRLNLFLIDPVPGAAAMGANADKWVDLDSENPALNACKIVYAQHDNTPGFAPLLPSYSPKVSVDVMPGTHATIVEAARHEGQLVRSQAVEFLSRHGTRFKRLQALDPRAKIALYEEMKRDYGNYTERMELGGFGRWSVTQRMETRSGANEPNGQIPSRHNGVINEDHAAALRALGLWLPPTPVPQVRRFGP